MTDSTPHLDPERLRNRAANHATVASVLENIADQAEAGDLPDVDPELAEQVPAALYED